MMILDIIILSVYDDVLMIMFFVFLLKIHITHLNQAPMLMAPPSDKKNKLFHLFKR